MRIKELREKETLTRAQLARKLDVKESEVEAWEDGTSEPSAELISEMATLFDCSPEEIACNKQIEETSKTNISKSFYCSQCGSKNVFFTTIQKRAPALRILFVLCFSTLLLIASLSGLPLHGSARAWGIVLGIVCILLKIIQHSVECTTTIQMACIDCYHEEEVKDPENS